MRSLRLAIAALFVVALALTGAAQTTQQKESTTQETTKTVTPVGFVTGTKCAKTGTYKAENKFIKVIIVVAEGEEFPPFVDGEKTTWYELTPSTKGTFDAVKVSTDSN
ncbi:MAG TPA: hypothetical protein VLB87_10850 [Pyrinomonadaceae bacterium]|nr:hypothetical protein [Pyrinomonadaceae bacterium]